MPTLGVQLLFESRPSLPVQQRPLGLRQVTEQRDIPHRAQHGECGQQQRVGHPVPDITAQMKRDHVVSDERHLAQRIQHVHGTPTNRRAFQTANQTYR